MNVRRVLSGLIPLSAAVLLLSGCTGGEETSAAQTRADQAAPPSAATQVVDPRQRLASINPAIPIYSGAEYSGDLTRRDNATVARQFGKDAIVYTLTTQDSFPQVWHYYVTYLAQFRQFEPLPALPPSNQVQRTIDVRLNKVMKDPFVPGDSLAADDPTVVLQVAETEPGKGAVIRYIVRPPEPPAPAVAIGPMLPDSASAVR